MAKTKSKRPPKTPKEKAFAREYLKTGNATEAASRVYDTNSRDSARNIGSQNVAKLSFSDIFENHGLSDQDLIQSLAEATKATKFSYNQETPDWNTRIKAIEICLKLKGTFAITEAGVERVISEEGSMSSDEIWRASMTPEQRELERYAMHIHSFYHLTPEQRKKAMKHTQEIIDKAGNTQNG